MRLSEIDLSNPDQFAAGPPHEAFKLLRREAPLFWNRNGGGEGFWALTRYRDIWNVSLDPRTFSTARRGTILRNWTEEEFASNQTLMINMDPPRHTKYRRLVNLGFSPKMTNRLEPHMREITRRIVDNIAARGACDLVTVLLDAEVEGEKLSELDFNSFFLLLLVAGNETTRNTISGGMLALFEHPEEWARLRHDPALLPTAVDEMVRWVSPVMYFVR